MATLQDHISLSQIYLRAHEMVTSPKKKHFRLFPTCNATKSIAFNQLVTQPYVVQEIDKEAQGWDSFEKAKPQEEQKAALSTSAMYAPRI